MTIIQDLWNNIQIRLLPKQIFASVTVTGSESKAPYNAFGILADFIFWSNTSRSKVAMTAPVISQKISQTIAMTAPVLSQKSWEQSYEVSFIMPSWYTLDTVPIPKNTNIRIHAVESKKIAVIHFGWYITQSKIDQYRNTLLTNLELANIKTIGESFVAQYNDPWTPPMMRTNEIWIEIKI